MGLTLTSPPDGEPIAAADVKAWGRIDDSAFDTQIALAIPAARLDAENATGRALLTQSWEQTFAGFPCAALALAKPPLKSVESVKYYDPDGVQQTLAPSAYLVHTSALSGLVAPVPDTHWPATQPRLDAVTVAFTAGYGAASDVPANLRLWIVLAVLRAIGEIEATAVNDGLLDAYRVIRFS